jgi:hypothetical protein
MATLLPRGSVYVTPIQAVPVSITGIAEVGIIEGRISEQLKRPIIKSRYTNVVNIYADIGLLNENITLEDILYQDKNYSFLQEVLREGEQELQLDLNGATEFLLNRYGVDLSKFRFVDGYWQSGEHRFFPYFRRGDYHASQLNCNYFNTAMSNCIEGGFVLIVGAPGIVARGSYGKEIGENISPGSIIFYGYYVFIEENVKGTVYHMRSNVPSHTSVETPLSWNLDVYDYKNNIWGKSIGSCIIDKKSLDIERHKNVVVENVSYIPMNNNVPVVTGVRNTRTVTTYRNNEPLPLIVNNIPVTSTRSDLITRNVNVPRYAPIIREELIDVQENLNIVAFLVSRSVVTFMM